MADDPKAPVPITMTNTYQAPQGVQGEGLPEPEPPVEVPDPVEDGPMDMAPTEGAVDYVPESETETPEGAAQETEGETSPVTPGAPAGQEMPEAPTGEQPAMAVAPEDEAMEFMLAGVGDAGIKALIKDLLKKATVKGAKGSVAQGVQGAAQQATSMTVAEVKQILSDGAIAAQRRGFRPRDPIYKEAEQLAEGMNPDLVKEIPAGTVMDDLDSATLVFFQKKAFDRAQQLSEGALEGLEKGDLTAFQELLKQVMLMGVAQPKKLGVVAESGRALGILNDPVSVINLQAQMLQEMLKQAPGDITPRAFIEMIRSLDDPAKMAKFASSIGKGVTRLDKWQEYWINAILSAPSTHVANMTDNALRATTAPIEALVWGMVPGSGVRMGDAAALFSGYLDGLRDFHKVLATTMKSGRDPFTREMRDDPMAVSVRLGQAATGESFAAQGRNIMSSSGGKVDQMPRKGITAANLGVNPQSPMGRAVDWAAEAIVRMPTRALMSEDAAFKMLFYRMGVSQYSYRKALEQAESEGLKGRALHARSRQLKRMFQDTPTDYEDVQKWAIDYAFEMTLQKELGKGGEAALHLREMMPITRFMAPFVRTPVNYAKMTIQYTPLEFFANAPGLKSVLTEQATIMRDGAQAGATLHQRMAREQVLSRAAFGSFLMAGAVASVAAGYTYGSDKDYKKTQFKAEHGMGLPNSVRVGSESIQFSRLGVFGQVFGLAADLEAMRRSSHSPLEIARYEEAVMIASVAIAKNITNPAFMQGFHNISRMIAEPDKFGKQETERFFASFVPNFMAQTNTAVVDTTVREARGVVQKALARTWGASKLFPARVRLIGGDDVDTEREVYDAVLQLKHLTVTAGPGIKAMVANGVFPEYPDEWFIGGQSQGGVEMDVYQRRKYVQLMNQIPFARSGKTLKEHLDWMVTEDPSYKREAPGPRAGQARMLMGTMREAEAMARAAMTRPGGEHADQDLIEKLALYREMQEKLNKVAQ